MDDCGLAGPRRRAAPRQRKIKGCFSRGATLAFLDDDDLYAPAYLEQALWALDRTADADVVFMGVEFFSSAPGGEASQDRAYMDRFLAASDAIEIERDLYVFGSRLLPALLLTGVPMAFQRPVVRRAAFERVGGYRAGLRYWDNDWVLRAVKGKLRVALLNRALYRQRIGTHQFISNDTELEHLENDLRVKMGLLRDLPGERPGSKFVPAGGCPIALQRAYFQRMSGNWLQSAKDYCAGAMTRFELRRTPFLASIPLAMARSVINTRKPVPRVKSGERN